MGVPVAPADLEAPASLPQQHEEHSALTAVLPGTPSGITATLDETLHHVESVGRPHDWWWALNNWRKRHAQAVFGRGTCSRIDAFFTSKYWLLFTVTVTIFCLYAVDVCDVTAGSIAARTAVSGFLLAFFIVFSLELILSVVFVDKYILSFFFWVDLVGTASLILDIQWFAENILKNDDSNALQITRAGRAARIGAQMGRITRVLRVLRLVRALRLLKVLQLRKRAKHGMEPHGLGNGPIRPTVLGELLAESTTRKCVVIILFVLVVSTFLQTTPPTAADYNRIQLLSYGVMSPESFLVNAPHPVLLLSYVDAINNTLVNFLRYDRTDMRSRLQLRTQVECAKYEGPSLEVCDAPDPYSTIWYDVTKTVQLNAGLNIVLTTVIIVCLGLSAYFFGRDATTYVIMPIETMLKYLKRMIMVGVDGDVESEAVNFRKPPETDVLANYVSRLVNEIDNARWKAEEEARISDTLLNSMVPPRIARQLKELRWWEAGPEQRAQTIADSFASATVLFTDIVGFTLLSSRISPEDAMRHLNNMYTIFDEIVEKYGLYKVETIGDSYMLVGGAPEERVDHAERVAAAALEIRACVPLLQEISGEPEINVRIGMHSGAVTAGVVGFKNPRWHLFGDTCNTASRMESTGIAGEIQLSSTTYELIKEGFQCKVRGKIAVKGKGEMVTYLLEREYGGAKRPDSPTGAGSTPQPLGAGLGGGGDAMDREAFLSSPQFKKAMERYSTARNSFISEEEELCKLLKTLDEATGTAAPAAAGSAAAAPLTTIEAVASAGVVVPRLAAGLGTAAFKQLVLVGVTPSDLKALAVHMHEELAMARAMTGAAEEEKAAAMRRDMLLKLYARVLEAPGMSLRDTFSVILDTMYKVVECDVIKLYIVDHARGQLWPANRHSAADSNRTLPLDGTLAGSAVRHARLVRVDDVALAAEFNSELEELPAGYTSKSMMCVPVFSTSNHHHNYHAHHLRPHSGTHPAAAAATAPGSQLQPGPGDVMAVLVAVNRWTPWGEAGVEEGERRIVSFGSADEVSVGDAAVSVGLLLMRRRGEMLLASAAPPGGLAGLSFSVAALPASVARQRLRAVARRSSVVLLNQRGNLWAMKQEELLGQARDVLSAIQRRAQPIALSVLGGAGEEALVSYLVRIAGEQGAGRFFNLAHSVGVLQGIYVTLRTHTELAAALGPHHLLALVLAASLLNVSREGELTSGMAAAAGLGAAGNAGGGVMSSKVSRVRAAAGSGGVGARGQEQSSNPSAHVRSMVAAGVAAGGWRSSEPGVQATGAGGMRKQAAAAAAAAAASTPSPVSSRWSRFALPPSPAREGSAGEQPRTPPSPGAVGGSGSLAVCASPSRADADDVSPSVPTITTTRQSLDEGSARLSAGGDSSAVRTSPDADAAAEGLPDTTNKNNIINAAAAAGLSIVMPQVGSTPRTSGGTPRGTSGATPFGTAAAQQGIPASHVINRARAVSARRGRLAAMVDDILSGETNLLAALPPAEASAVKASVAMLLALRDQPAAVLAMPGLQPGREVSGGLPGSAEGGGGVFASASGAAVAAAALAAAANGANSTAEGLAPPPGVYGAGGGGGGRAHGDNGDAAAEGDAAEGRLEEQGSPLSLSELMQAAGSDPVRLAETRTAVCALLLLTWSELLHVKDTSSALSLLQCRATDVRNWAFRLAANVSNRRRSVTLLGCVDDTPDDIQNLLLLEVPRMQLEVIPLWQRTAELLPGMQPQLDGLHANRAAYVSMLQNTASLGLGPGSGFGGDSPVAGHQHGHYGGGAAAGAAAAAGGAVSQRGSPSGWRSSLPRDLLGGSGTAREPRRFISVKHRASAIARSVLSVMPSGDSGEDAGAPGGRGRGLSYVRASSSRSYGGRNAPEEYDTDVTPTVVSKLTRKGGFGAVAGGGALSMRRSASRSVINTGSRLGHQAAVHTLSGALGDGDGFAPDRTSGSNHSFGGQPPPAAGQVQGPGGSGLRPRSQTHDVMLSAAGAVALTEAGARRSSITSRFNHFFTSFKVSGRVSRAQLPLGEGSGGSPAHGSANSPVGLPPPMPPFPGSTLFGNITYYQHDSGLARQGSQQLQVLSQHNLSNALTAASPSAGIVLSPYPSQRLSYAESRIASQSLSQMQSPTALSPVTSFKAPAAPPPPPHPAGPLGAPMVSLDTTAAPATGGDRSSAHSTSSRLRAQILRKLSNVAARLPFHAGGAGGGAGAGARGSGAAAGGAWPNPETQSLRASDGGAHHSMAAPSQAPSQAPSFHSGPLPIAMLAPSLRRTGTLKDQHQPAPPPPPTPTAHRRASAPSGALALAQQHEQYAATVAAAAAAFAASQAAAAADEPGGGSGDEPELLTGGGGSVMSLPGGLGPGGMLSPVAEFTGSGRDSSATGSPRTGSTAATDTPRNTVTPPLVAGPLIGGGPGGGGSTTAVQPSRFAPTPSPNASTSPLAHDPFPRRSASPSPAAFLPATAAAVAAAASSTPLSLASRADGTAVTGLLRRPPSSVNSTSDLAAATGAPSAPLASIPIPVGARARPDSQEMAPELSASKASPGSKGFWLGLRLATDVFRSAGRRTERHSASGAAGGEAAQELDTPRLPSTALGGSGPVTATGSSAGASRNPSRMHTPSASLRRGGTCVSVGVGGVASLQAVIDMAEAALAGGGGGGGGGAHSGHYEYRSSLAGGPTSSTPSRNQSQRRGPPLSGGGGGGGAGGGGGGGGGGRVQVEVQPTASPVQRAVEAASMEEQQQRSSAPSAPSRLSLRRAPASRHPADQAPPGSLPPPLPHQE